MSAALELSMKRPHSRLISTLTNGKADGAKPKRRAKMSPQRVHKFVESLVADHMHAKRVLSMSGAVVGVLHAASLGVHAIGLGLAEVVGLHKKHAVKQVDRLLSNRGIDVWEEFSTWVPFALGARREALVALDWTEFDADDQVTLCLSLVTSHGRATPLMWMTVVKSELAEQRNAHEDKLLSRLAEVVPEDIELTILADRGFGDQARYEQLEELGFKFIIRFRQCIEVTTAKGDSRPAADLLSASGRAKIYRDVEVTKNRTPLAAVVVVHNKKMKDPWCLATNRDDLSASKIVKAYGRRFTIEETFRDTKDPRFGLGMSNSRIKKPERRDRLFFLAAIAGVLLTLLGAAGEAIGIDRYLKVNTSKKRQYSLYRQGTEWYGLIPMMDARQLRRLMKKFGELIQDHAMCRRVVGVV